MFKVKCSDIPDFIMGTENNSLTELGMPGVASGLLYQAVGAGQYQGPVSALEYGNYVTGGDYPWLPTIPGYVNKAGRKLVYRSCCHYINPTTNGTIFTSDSSTEDWYNDGNNNWYDREGGQSLFEEPTSHIMVAMQAGGGGGSGSSGSDSGAGGGAGAAAILIINLGKLSEIHFEPGTGGAAGSKGISASTNRHGEDGTSSTIRLTMKKDNTILTLRAENGTAGKQYSSNNGGYNEKGVGGTKLYTENRNGEAVLGITESDLSSVNYIGIKYDGTKLAYPDTNYEAVAYVLKVFPGGDGGIGGIANTSTNGTSPISVSAATFYPGITETPAIYPNRLPTIPDKHVFGLKYGGDGGYSAYGEGGEGSYSYISQASGWSYYTNATAPTGWGAGGAGDVFYALKGKDGTAGGDGFIQILSANSTTSQLPDILPQSGILSPGAIECSYIKLGDSLKDEDYGTPEFVACSYAYNNNNILTPTLYTVGSNPNKYPIDWNGAYFHIGTEAINGTTYDKWQKIETDGQYTWNSTSKKIAYTNIVVKNNRFIVDLCNREGVHTVDTSSDAIVVAPTCIEQGYTYSKCTECGYRFKGNYTAALGHKIGDWEITIEPTITETGKKVKKCSRCKNIIEEEILPMLDPEVGTYDMLATNAVIVKAYEYIDSSLSYGNSRANDEFVAGGYLKNNVNVIVPVLYKNDSSVSNEPDMGDAFFYVGQETFNGVICDKWRKIGNTAITNHDVQYTWASSYQQYIYTNVVVSNNRFASNIFTKSVSGTITIPWTVTKAPAAIGGLSTYSFRPTPKTVPADDGYIIQEVTSLTCDTMGTTSGKAPVASPSSSISSDGKTLSITLTSSVTPLSTGEGDAIINYTYACGPVYEVVDSTSVSIPYTTSSSPTGNLYSITSQSPATITAPDGYVIMAIEGTKFTSSNGSHGTSSVTLSPSIASDKKTATVSLNGSIQGAGGSALMTVNCAVTYRQVG